MESGVEGTRRGVEEGVEGKGGKGTRRAGTGRERVRDRIYTYMCIHINNRCMNTYIYILIIY